jgi:hypothetical protein
MPAGRKPLGERALTGAEREARRQERIRQRHALANEALAFLLSLEDQDAYSMPWEKKKALRNLQFRGRMKAFDDNH